LTATAHEKYDCLLFVFDPSLTEFEIAINDRKFCRLVSPPEIGLILDQFMKKCNGGLGPVDR
jgi:hypothetical protein